MISKGNIMPAYDKSYPPVVKHTHATIYIHAKYTQTLLPVSDLYSTTLLSSVGIKFKCN